MDLVCLLVEVITILCLGADARCVFPQFPGAPSSDPPSSMLRLTWRNACGSCNPSMRNSPGRDQNETYHDLACASLYRFINHLFGPKTESQEISSIWSRCSDFYCIFFKKGLMMACFYRKNNLEIRSSEEVLDDFYLIIFVTF